MLFEGSFWVRRDIRCFDKTEFGLLSKQNDTTSQELSIQYREEYLNVSEDRKLLKILIERYSNNTISIYITSVRQQYIYDVFNKLSEHSPGYYTMMNTYGPLAINFEVGNVNENKTAFQIIMRAIDYVEYINPYQIRERVFLTTNSEIMAVEY